MIILGCITVIFGCACYFLLIIDSNVIAKSEEEREVIRLRMKDNAVVASQEIKFQQIREALTESRFYCLVLFELLLHFQNGALLTFSSIITKGLGFSVSDHATPHYLARKTNVYYLESKLHFVEYSDGSRLHLFCLYLDLFPKKTCQLYIVYHLYLDWYICFRSLAFNCHSRSNREITGFISWLCLHLGRCSDIRFHGQQCIGIYQENLLQLFSCFCRHAG